MLHLLVPQYITSLIWAYQSPHAFCTILAFSISFVHPSSLMINSALCYCACLLKNGMTHLLTHTHTHTQDSVPKALVWTALRLVWLVFFIFFFNLANKAVNLRKSIWRTQPSEFLQLVLHKVCQIYAWGNERRERPSGDEEGKLASSDEKKKKKKTKYHTDHFLWFPVMSCEKYLLKTVLFAWSQQAFFFFLSLFVCLFCPPPAHLSCMSASKARPPPCPPVGNNSPSESRAWPRPPRSGPCRGSDCVCKPNTLHTLCLSKKKKKTCACGASVRLKGGRAMQMGEVRILL